MSLLNKLGIAGIRSYSPDSLETIDFKPLTLICGQNGSGKTTIIQCLKFVTTGIMPVGTMGGKSFVLDPKLISRPQVIGEVKLNFSSYGGKKFVTGRKVMLSYVKRKGFQKVQFKSIEQVIKTRDDVTNELVSINHHCAQIDKQIPALFGVSKSVLQNIIFCQQDQALWPFGDNTTLKGIFDELFQTNQYARVYETIKETHKKIVKQIKQLNIILQAKRNQYNRTIKIKKNNLGQYQDLCKKSKVLPRIKSKINEYEKKNSEFALFRNELVQIVQIVGQFEANILNLVKQAKNICVSEIQLQRLQVSDNLLTNTSHQLNQIRQQIQSDTLQIKRLEQIISNFKIEQLERQVGNVLEFEVNSVHKKFKFAGEPSLANVLNKLNKSITQLEAQYSRLDGFKKQLLSIRDPQIYSINQKQLESLKIKQDISNRKCAQTQNLYSIIYSQIYTPQIQEIKRVQYSQLQHEQFKFLLRSTQQKLDKINQQRQIFLKKQGHTYKKSNIQQMKYGAITIREQMLEFAIQNKRCTFCSKQLNKNQIHQIENKCTTKINKAKQKINQLQRNMDTQQLDCCPYSSIQQIDSQKRKLLRDIETYKNQIQSSSELQNLHKIYVQNTNKWQINKKIDYHLQKHELKINHNPKPIHMNNNINANIDAFVQCINDYVFQLQQLKNIRNEIKRLQSMRQTNREREVIRKNNERRRHQCLRHIQQLQSTIQPLPLLKQSFSKLNSMKAKSQNTSKSKQKPKSKFSKQTVESELLNKKQSIESLSVIKIIKEKQVQIQKLAAEYQQNKNELNNIIAKRKHIESELQKFKSDIEKHDKLKMQYISLKTMIQTRLKGIQDEQDKLEQYQQLLLEFKIKEQNQKELTYTMKAIQLTLTQFHSQKLEEINRILKETWQSIYRKGDYIESEKDRDIQYIKIRSYDEESTTQQGKKKPYCYALMMGIDGGQIEMKGRCSMGQKVLASIVIRLALAQCFASKCNVLALDQPTANLDSGHVRSLSESLGKLIEYKRQQNDFQLIIITHDMDFMAMMTKYTPSYYQVKKVDGWSKIVLNQQM